MLAFTVLLQYLKCATFVLLGSEFLECVTRRRTTTRTRTTRTTTRTTTFPLIDRDARGENDVTWTVESSIESHQYQKKK